MPPYISPRPWVTRFDLLGCQYGVERSWQQGGEKGIAQMDAKKSRGQNSQKVSPQDL